VLFPAAIAVELKASKKKGRPILRRFIECFKLRNSD
jgi:hypothetical protein